jgi:hypothetical protein
MKNEVGLIRESHLNVYSCVDRFNSWRAQDQATNKQKCREIYYYFSHSLEIHSVLLISLCQVMAGQELFSNIHLE